MYATATFTGIIVCFLGIFSQDDILTAPFTGYDTNVAKDLGHYRLIMHMILLAGIESGKLVHASGGASGFKKNRGAYAVRYCLI